MVELTVRQITVIPQGGLGLFPLHAAWRLVDGQKRCLLDDVELRYVPSGYALKIAQERAAAHQGKSVLVAGVSKYLAPEKYPDLPNVPMEIETIAGCFGTAPLLDAQATRQAVIDQVPGKAYMHLSCHGHFAFGNATDSAMYLNDKPLTMTDILTKLNFDAARLVSLSACETGIADITRNPDEFVGLTAAFMQSGVPGVVSTLWTVEDYSTALLMERFYSLHLKEGKPPAAALREAQLWLRGLTRAALLSWLEVQNGPRDKRREIKLGGAPGDNIYASPYYWAAFTYTGT